MYHSVLLRADHQVCVGAPRVLLPVIVPLLRAAGTDGRWWLPDPPRDGDRALHVALRAPGDVQGALRDRIRAVVARSGWHLDVSYRVLDTVVEPDEEIAWTSSEFALATTAIGAADDRMLRIATWHLRQVLRLVPQKAQPEFLFLYWREASAKLGGDARAELSRQAHRRSDEVLRALTRARLADDVVTWAGRYLRALHRARRDDSLYGLFSHALATGRRLDVPPAVEALAAMVLRNGMTTGSAAFADCLDDRLRVPEGVPAPAGSAV